MDEENGFERALYARFRSNAHTLLMKGGASDAKTMNAALDRLLQDALSRSIRDQESIGEDKRYDLLAMQPLVFARLAGFLAAHACLREDPLRKVIEALMLGYTEAEEMEPSHGHDHDHDPRHGPLRHGRDHHP